MKPTLIQLPDDILLALVSRFFTLEDALLIAATHPRFRALGTTPSFWIDILERERLTKPLPCPDSQTLATLDAQTLQRLARHVVRRERNLSRTMPRTVGPAKLVKPRLENHGGSIQYITHIRGTALFLFRLHDNGHVVLYDVDQQALQKTVCICSPRQGYITTSSASEDNGGVFIFTICERMAETYSRFRAYAVSYNEPVIQTREVLTQKTIDYISGTFVHKIIAGFVCDRGFQGVTLEAFNLESGKSLKLTQTPHFDFARIECFFERDDLIVLYGTLDGGFLYQKFSRYMLPYDVVTTTDHPTTAPPFHGPFSGPPASSNVFSSMALSFGVASLPGKRTIIGHRHQILFPMKPPFGVSITFFRGAAGENFLATSITVPRQGEVGVGGASTYSYYLGCGAAASVVISGRGKDSFPLPYVSENGDNTIAMRFLETPVELEEQAEAIAGAVTEVVWDDHRGVVVLVLGRKGDVWHIPYA